jgi:hypothetical protein
VSLFVVSPEIEDPDEVEVATGRSTKRPSSLNYIILCIFKWIKKTIGHELIFFSCSNSYFPCNIIGT